MDGTTVAIIAFVVGALLGGAGAWLALPARLRNSSLEQERDDARAALQRYRDDVDHHFLKTAELVNELSRAYSEVHQQLSDGARQLCSEQGRRLASAQYRDTLEDRKPSGPVSAPLDYAPSHGTLAEDFGLRREAQPFAPMNTDADEDDVAGYPPRDYAEGFDDGADEPASKAGQRA